MINKEVYSNNHNNFFDKIIQKKDLNYKKNK